jgi:membrane-bound metal-dependent hydrolase YbcI (DUF457 family)
VDIATHALASYTLARGFFPRRRWPVVVGMIFAGAIADIDLVSTFFGPAAYFANHRTYTHSVLGTLFIVALSIVIVRFFVRNQPKTIVSLLLPLGAAAVLHLLLDLLQSEGMALLWPFSSLRFATDWLPSIDPWVLALLIAGIFFPELLRLVSSEIGAKSKMPRGRNGAIIAFVLVFVYIGARAILHSGSMATLEPHSYHGESARRVGAFPDALSLFTWHGVVETQSLLCVVEVPTAFGHSFDAGSAECFHKPEPSLELGAAEKTVTAQKYLHATPFPRAIVAKTQDGYEVVLRSVGDIAHGEVRRRVAVRVLLDSKFWIASQEFVWARDVTLK